MAAEMALKLARLLVASLKSTKPLKTLAKVDTVTASKMACQVVPSSALTKILKMAPKIGPEVGPEVSTDVGPPVGLLVGPFVQRWVLKLDN
jgi:hypothetical protein